MPKAPPAPPGDSARASKASSKKKDQGPKTPWRDNIEAGVMAILLALFLKAFLVEAYKIPSGSMQPTLMGMPSPGQVVVRRPGEQPLEVKDRILVDKLSYKVRDPKRWEVIVFRYPLKHTQNFVKRLVGLPGEQLRILYGDLWTRQTDDEPWQILRRPSGVQSSHWRALNTGELTVSPWNQVSGSGWLLDGRDVTVRGDGAIEFGGGEPIFDRYFDGYPASIRKHLPDYHPSNERRHPVGDLRLTGSITATAETESIAITLREGQRRYTFELAGPAASTASSIRVEPGAAAREEATASAEGVALRAGRSVRFEVENLDDQLTLRIDGDVVAQLEVREAIDQSSGLMVESRGGDAELQDLRVLRDTYYFSNTQQFEIPEDGYFALGDNTLDSSDSREWSRARFRVLGGEGEPVVLEGNNRTNDNPSRPNVEPGVGSFRRFTDQWGVHHLIAQPSNPSVELPDWLTPVEQLAAEPSPYIDRGLIVGRALAVFWPIAPHKSIVRLRWVR